MTDTENNRLLRHLLATLAYRTQVALRGAPPDFGEFAAGHGVRTPRELMNHMANLIGFTTRALRGEPVAPLDETGNLSEEVARFHALLGDLSALLDETPLELDETSDRLLQGPLSDAMTHVGQLALLRRLAGSPVGPQSYFRAPITRENGFEPGS